ncbi:MAG TPA: hypothetical protein VLH56_19615 [Dissulfurispiraceae bacterium]|nr:hypothetical protein [Dissulfurispiraceae bacterium]
MKVSLCGLDSRKQTGKRMRWLVQQFAADLNSIMVNGRSMADLSAQDVFDFVRTIPYKRDTRPIEVIARPRYIMDLAKSGIDCKKKAVLLASWATLNGVPWRFIGMSSRPDGQIHHVFPQFQDALGNWINYDATYSRYSIGQQKRITKAEIL